MKMRRLEYIFNGLDLDICCQGNDSEQHSKKLFIKTLLIKNIVIPRYAWKFETHVKQYNYRPCFKL